MLTGISTINVNIRDYKKAIDFYTKQLGMTLTVNDPDIDHYEVAARPSMSPGICLCVDKDFTAQHTGIIFSTNDIQLTCKTLREQGVKVTEPYKAHGEWWAGFRDLDGNSYGLNQK
jgi:predicted enzyme related to lactoylglutathione lyase